MREQRISYTGESLWTLDGRLLGYPGGGRRVLDRKTMMTKGTKNRSRQVWMSWIAIVGEKKGAKSVISRIHNG